MFFVRAHLRSEDLAPAIERVRSFYQRMMDDDASVVGLKAAIEPVLDLADHRVRQCFADNGQIPLFGPFDETKGPLIFFKGRADDPITPDMVRGSFDPALPNRIALSKSIAAQLGAQAGDPAMPAWAQVLESTLLEEIVHWLEVRHRDTLDEALFQPKPGDTGRRVVRLFFNQAGEEPGLPPLPGITATPATDVVQALRDLIKDKRIIFDKPLMKKQLLGDGTGTTATRRLQELVLGLTEITANQIRISSVVRTNSTGHHRTGRAVDIGNEEIAADLLPTLATRANVVRYGIDELIFDASVAGKSNRNHWNYDRGLKHDYNAATLDGHKNHIHIAVLS